MTDDIKEKKVPSAASFEKVNDIFHALDETLGKKLEELNATPYEVHLAIECLSYKLKTHEMVAFFTQCIDSLQDRDRKHDEGKDHPYYK